MSAGELGLAFAALAGLALALALLTMALSRRDRPVWPMRFNLFLIRHGRLAAWGRRYAASRSSFSRREQFAVSFFIYLFLLSLLAFGGKGARAWIEHRALQQERLVVWLPFAAGDRARCLQGPMGDHSHNGYHAWDFGLPEGRPVVAAAAGRVIRVVDDRTRTGVNNFDDTNQVFVDHGEGFFAVYLHHVAGTARVRPGQVIAAGTVLADVGRTGTLVPHIHFDLRGPSWHQTHEVRFRVSGEEAAQVAGGQTIHSRTPAAGAPPERFRDSLLLGKEFAANGITLRRLGFPAFRMYAGVPLVIRGRAESHVKRVFFYLWRDSEPSEYIAEATPYESGWFELAIKVPESARGSRWYRITAHDKAGRLADAATLPVLVQ